jgi:hypothetical protein
MAIKTQSYTEPGVVQGNELDVLREILRTQGGQVSRSEVSDMAHEIVSFFEAFEDSNDDVGADDHA